MVLRLLAASAEHWLGAHLNDYLRHSNEYRAMTRNLLHLGSQITYAPTAICHRHPEPARPARAGPRPGPAPRRDQRHPAPRARRPASLTYKLAAQPARV